MTPLLVHSVCSKMYSIPPKSEHTVTAILPHTKHRISLVLWDVRSMPPLLPYSKLGVSSSVIIPSQSSACTSYNRRAVGTFSHFLDYTQEGLRERQYWNQDNNTIPHILCGIVRYPSRKCPLVKTYETEAEISAKRNKFGLRTVVLNRGSYHTRPDATCQEILLFNGVTNIPNLTFLTSGRPLNPCFECAGSAGARSGQG